MSKFKKGLMKRVMAVILSGAMVMSNMTAFASEAPADTGGYVEEVAEDASGDDSTDSESTDKDEVENNAETESTSEDAATEETTKSEDNASDGKDDTDNEKKTEVETVEATDTEVTDEELTSEVESSLSAETEETEPEEKDEKNEVVKADYSYKAPEVWSTNWSDYYVFKGSVFGQDQGIKVNEFAVKEDTDHTMYLEDNYGRAKIAREGSGSATYLYQLPVDKAFTLTARATVKTIASGDSQAGFGLMARDDMLIDTSCTNVTTADCVNVPGRGTDYVVAGTLGTGVNCFKRDNTLWDTSASQPSTLGTGAAVSNPQVGDVYNLSLSFDGNNTYTCKFGENDAVTYIVNDTFNLKRVDKDFQYVGMFVSRKTSVNFDRIYLETGSGENKKVVMDQRSSVSGTIEGITGSADGLEVILTDKDGKSTNVPVTNDNGTYKYETKLYAGDYSVGLSDKNYTMSQGSAFTIENKAAEKLDDTINNIVLEGVSRVKVSGTLDIPEGADLDDLKITFSMEGDPVSATITGTSYSAELAAESTYEVIAEAKYIDDYTYDVKSVTVGTTAITDKVIKFTKKPTYEITIKVVSYDDNVTIPDNSNITFTTLNENNEEGIPYTTQISNNKISLKDGTYSVSTNIDVKYPYYLTLPKLVVEGGNKTYTLNFEERLVWDFTIADPALVGGTIGQGGLNSDGTEKYKDDQFYNGLYINTGLVKDSEGNYLDASGNIVEAAKAIGGKFDVRVGEKRVQVNNSTKVKIPVSGRGKVAISPADGSFMLKKLTDKDQDASTVADQNKNGEITYNEDTRYILMEATGLVWLTKIEVTRDPAVEVSGSILNPNNLDLTGCTMSFVNQTDDTTIPVEIKDDNSYTVKLTSGHTYVATLSGNAQYGFAETNKTIEVKTINMTDIDLTVVSKDTIKYSGKITGFEQDYERLDNLKVILTAGAEKTELTITKENTSDISFEAVLESGTEYTIKLEGVDDYSLTSEATIQKTADYTADITVEKKPTYKASGKFLELDDAVVTKLSFTRLNEEGVPDRNYVYEAELNAAKDGYSVMLRDGEYEASAEVDGYATKTHVIVNGETVERDLLFIWTDTSALAYKADLYVGYTDKEDNYKTVTKALKAAKRMSPSADKRITIHIAPGTYREQIIVDVPYITFKNDTPSEEVKLTWYYGIGYKYYSIKPSLGEDGFYDAEYAYNKTEKHTAFRWGCTVQVKATDFRAENIVFENSFNRYLTKEEIADGVEPIEQKDPKNNKPVRNDELDLRSRAAGERAAALYIEDQGDKAEFYNCQFLSNQDTIGTGSTTPRSYFKNCLIEGNTDYICGAGDAVFDNCELKFAGYSDASSGGYITAASVPRQYGYLFWNCTVTGTNDPYMDKGYLGRPWNKKEDKKLATVTFVNTILDRADIIEPVGWKEMGDFKPSDVHYKEYNTTVKGGGAADTSKRTAGTVVSENPVPDMTVYFDGWTPAYYNYVDAPTSETKQGTVVKGTEVVLKCAAKGAQIRYTINGDAPTAESTLYVEETPIVLDTEGTIVIKAIAIKGDLKSSVATFEYKVVDPAKFVAAPTATPEAGEVEKGTKVTLECDTEAAVIYYTTDGTTIPTAKSTKYEAPISINEATTIKAIAIKGENASEVVEFAYTIKQTTVDPKPETVAKPTADRPDGVVPVGKTVTLSCVYGAKIYYTMDGTTEPTGKDSELYDGKPIALGNEAKTIVIMAIAVMGDAKSEVATFTYTVSTDIDPDKFVSAPVATPDPEDGEVAKGTKVTLFSATPDVKIYYTMDGATEPTEESTEYTEPIDLGYEAGKVVIKAIAIKGENKSDISTFEYTVKEDGVSGDNDQVKAPVATPAPAEGAVASGTEVRLTSATKDAKIYYTTDGTEPTTESKLYTDPITITNAVTIKAFAVKDGLKDSAVVTFAYTITSGPVVPVEPDDPGIDKNNIWITGLEDTYVYTGAKIIPDIKVWDCDIKGDQRLLAPGVDYTVAYKNNVKPGTKTAEVIVTGKGNYAGKGVTEKFSIKEADDVQNPVNVKGAKIDKIGDMKYSGKALYPDFKLTLKDKTSFEYIYDSETSKYTRKGSGEMNVNIAVSNNVNKGTATILVTGEKDAKGKATSVKATFKITPIDLSTAADVEVIPSPAVYAVNGAVPETLTVTCGGKQLVKGIDYTVKYSGNKKAGTAGTATVTGKGNYTKKVKPVAYTINKLDMSQLSVNAVTVYEGITAGKIKATVVDKNGNALKPAQYTLKIYKDAGGNTPYDAKDKTKLTAGTVIYVEATAAAKETNLTGSTPRAEFKVGKDISKAKFVLTQKKGLPYTGSAIELTEKDLTVTMKNVTGSLKMGEDYVITAYSNNINKGTATAVIKGIGDYSGTKTIKFKITQKTMIKGTANTSD